LLSRSVDVLMAIAALIFAMLLLSMFGTSVGSLILIIDFRYPHQVSGGQLQRAMTAMAMN